MPIRQTQPICSPRKLAKTCTSIDCFVAYAPRNDGETTIMKNKLLLAFAAAASAFLFAGCISISKNIASFSEVEQKTAAHEIRAVQISDCHFSKEKPLFDAVVETINRLNPDVIFMTGDQAVSIEAIKIMEHYLKKLNVPCPKFAINGNWEYSVKTKVFEHFDEYHKALEDSDFKLLKNQGETLDFDGKKLVLFGLDSLLGGEPSFEGFEPEKNAANVVLGHCPLLFDQMPQIQDIPLLMLSGHTHGGQVLLFGKAVYFPEGTGKYYSGIYQKGWNTLYVSTGIGNSSLEIRNLTPCIELITFKFDAENNFIDAEFQTIEVEP